jgi:hypothetical protein
MCILHSAANSGAIVGCIPSSLLFLTYIYLFGVALVGTTAVHLVVCILVTKGFFFKCVWLHSSPFLWCFRALLGGRLVHQHDMDGV